MAQQFLTGHVYANGDVVTGDNLNSAVNNAILLPGAISSQTTGSPETNDWILYSNNAFTAFKKIQVEPFLSLSQGFTPTTPKAAAFIAPGEVHPCAFTFTKTASYTAVIFTGPTYFPGTVLVGHKYYLDFSTTGAVDGVYEVVSVVGTTVNFALAAAGTAVSGVGSVYFSAVNRFVNVSNVVLTSPTSGAVSSLIVNLSSPIPLTSTYSPFISCAGHPTAYGNSATQFRLDYSGTTPVARTTVSFAVQPLLQTGGAAAPGNPTTILIYAPYSS